MKTLNIGERCEANPDAQPEREGANEHQGATRMTEPVVCSELHGNERAEAAEMAVRQRVVMAYLAGPQVTE